MTTSARPTRSARPLSRPRRNRPALVAAAAALLTVLAGCSTMTSGVALRSSGALPQADAGTGSPAATDAAGATGAPPTVITQPSSGPGAHQNSAPAPIPGTASSPATAASQAPATGSSAPTRTTGPAGAVPAGLARYYDQILSWGPCAAYATAESEKSEYAITSLSCARLTVPLAYADPTGPTITIGVMRKAATGTSRIGSVVFDPGGPGASGMQTVADMVSNRVGGTLNARFDLVGFDPRGVGASSPPVHCQSDTERDAERTMDGRSQTAAQVAAKNADTKARIAECVQNTGKAQGIDGLTFLANIGTRDVARDLDVLRGVLGDSKLTYVGFSYGTRIGYVYAEEFPTNIRAMILDGVESPDEDPAASSLAQGKAFQDAFQAFAQWCAQNTQDCPLGSDPTQATAVFQSLVRPLLASPLALADGRKLSFGDAISGTSEALYSDSYRSILAKGLTNLRSGDGTIMMALADQYADRDSTGHYDNLLEVFDAVRCVEAPKITDPAAITKLNAEFNQVAPYQDSGDPAGAIADACAYWPVPATYTPHKLSIPKLTAKVLVISTKGDPATPYADGVAVADQLHAALLSVEGSRHTAYLLQGINCADQAGNAYLIDLQTPAAGADCS